MEGHVKLTAAALLAIVFGVCAGVELTKVDAETVRPSTSAVTLSNLTDADRQVFYHLEEGSEVFPLDWILALRQKDTNSPSFRTPSVLV